MFCIKYSNYKNQLINCRQQFILQTISHQLFLLLSDSLRLILNCTQQPYLNPKNTRSIRIYKDCDIIKHSRMKSQLARSTLTRKPSTKVLIEKKNSGVTVESTLKKEKSKPNLIINNYPDTMESNTNNVMNAQKVTSPKNAISSSHNNTAMTASVRKETTDEHVQQQEKLQTSNKKPTQVSKLKKSDISRKQPIKKQSLSTLRSPKSSKPSSTSSTIQSQVFIKQFQPFVQISEYEQLSVSMMSTSLVKTEQLQQSILLSNSNISERNQLLQEESLSLSFVKQQIHPKGSVSILKQHEMQELARVVEQKSEEIVRLKEVNESLERKLNRMRLAQDENKRKLRQRITAFNEQGEEIKHMSEKIIQLEKQIHFLLSENDTLRNTIAENTLSNSINQSQQQTLTQSNITAHNCCIFRAIQLQIPAPNSQQRDRKLVKSKDVVDMVDKGVMKGFQDCDKKELLGEEMKQVISTGLSSVRDLYEDRCREKLSMLQNCYSSHMSNMQQRISLFLAESQQIISQQQSQITYLQAKLDTLYQKIQQSPNAPSKSLSIDTDQQQLLHMREINSYKAKLAEKDQVIRRTRQQLHTVQVGLNAVKAQLEMQRIRHSLDYQVDIIKKQLLDLCESERSDLLREQLRLSTQVNTKLVLQNAKKEQLIRKLSVAHQHQLLSASSNSGNRKIRK